MTINIEHEVSSIDGLDEDTIVNEVIEEAMNYVDCPYEAEINVVFTDNEGIHSINKEFRQIDSPTDVLSFPMVDYSTPAYFEDIEDNLDYFNPESGELVLGDIVLSKDKIIEQAESYGHSQKRELAFLVAHSMLHLFGYDHMVEEEAKVMFAKQEEILNNLGITR